MLELEHIQKAFDGVPVLKDLSLQVEDGEIVSILGPSGCGKTTLLNIILGLSLIHIYGGVFRYRNPSASVLDGWFPDAEKRVHHLCQSEDPADRPAELLQPDA